MTDEKLESLINHEIKRLVEAQDAIRGIGYMLVDRALSNNEQQSMGYALATMAGAILDDANKISVDLAGMIKRDCQEPA